MGLYEMLEFDEEIKAMLLDGERSLAVEKYALEQKGMVNLERDAYSRWYKGRLVLRKYIDW
ncbi:MAG: hypothetical protein H6765_07195 [Candidatus Peribacteria bacterium]|nr:MAG: hypothetical protein H6765_07195 [Candidatus Peribacteria bacterium]